MARADRGTTAARPSSAGAGGRAAGGPGTPGWVKRSGVYEVEVDGMASTCTSRIAVHERFSFEPEWFARRAERDTVLDTPLWLTRRDLPREVRQATRDAIAPLSLCARDDQWTVNSVVEAVTRLQHWNFSRSHVSLVGRLRLRRSDPDVLVIEVWDARRPWMRSSSLTRPGPGYRYFSTARLRVR